MKDEIKEILEDYGCIPRIKKLGDYITNLQEENKQLKEQIKKDNHILGCNFASKDKYKQELEDYKSRNEKAIEDINKMMAGIYSRDGEYLWESGCCNIKLKIIKNDLLNGGDEEI